MHIVAHLTKACVPCLLFISTFGSTLGNASVTTRNKLDPTGAPRTGSAERAEDGEQTLGLSGSCSQQARSLSHGSCPHSHQAAQSSVLLHDGGCTRIQFTADTPFLVSTK